MRAQDGSLPLTATIFAPATEALLEQAASLCTQRGARLTALRRHVLGLVLESGRPAGAYELLERMRSMYRGAAPPTVYRALDFLLSQGLVHRIERLSAFIGCIGDAEHAHAAQFLICERCGRADEIDDPELVAALARAASRAGFAVSGATVEAGGVCAACRTEG